MEPTSLQFDEKAVKLMPHPPPPPPKKREKKKTSLRQNLHGWDLNLESCNTLQLARFLVALLFRISIKMGQKLK